MEDSFKNFINQLFDDLYDYGYTQALYDCEKDASERELKNFKKRIEKNKKELFLKLNIPIV